MRSKPRQKKVEVETWINECLNCLEGFMFLCCMSFMSTMSFVLCTGGLCVYLEPYFVRGGRGQTDGMIGGGSGETTLSFCLSFLNNDCESFDKSFASSVTRLC